MGKKQKISKEMIIFSLSKDKLINQLMWKFVKKANFHDRLVSSNLYPIYKNSYSEFFIKFFVIYFFIKFQELFVLWIYSSELV